MKKFTIVFILVLSTMVAKAQVDKKAEENKPAEKSSALKSYYNSGKKVGFTANDSLFQMNIGFRVQSRVGYIDVDGKDPVIEGEIRRMRLKLDGFVLSPKFGYKVELGFSARDIGVVAVGNSGNVILDGTFFYKPNSDLKLTFGQTKLPGNHQRVVSSNNLELTDRTINNSAFNIDRDFGFFVDYAKEKKDNFYIGLKGAITKGEGRNWVKTADDGIALTAKVQLFPFGAFTKDGSDFEGDLAREKKPKLMLSGAFSQNNHAVRSQGQLGSALYDPRTLKSVFVDAMFKYKGWTAMTAYMSRDADNPITVDPLNSSNTQAVLVGSGIDTQLSYVFPSNYQLIARYSVLNTKEEIQLTKPKVEEFTLGVSKYIFNHKMKLQTECSYDNITKYGQSTTNSWIVRFQVEIGL